jgi:hypothetical protein
MQFEVVWILKEKNLENINVKCIGEKCQLILCTGH